MGDSGSPPEFEELPRALGQLPLHPPAGCYSPRSRIVPTLCATGCSFDAHLPVKPFEYSSHSVHLRRSTRCPPTALCYHPTDGSHLTARKGLSLPPPSREFHPTFQR